MSNVSHTQQIIKMNREVEEPQIHTATNLEQSGLNIVRLKTKTHCTQTLVTKFVFHWGMG